MYKRAVKSTITFLDIINIFNIKRTFMKFSEFDNVTEFRLQNSYAISIMMALMMPIIIVLKGLVMAAWIISVFGILNMLAIKSNNYFVKKYTIGELYKIGNILHLLGLVGTLIYFINVEVMIWVESIVVILDYAIYSSYSIALTNYLTKEHPYSMSEFQIVKNSSYADSSLIGLFITTLVTFYFTVGVAIGVYIVFSLLFLIWLFKNWNIYNAIEKKGY